MRTEPDKWVSLRRGQDMEVLSALGEKRTLRIAEVPGRLAIDMLMAAGNEDPQAVVALATGMEPADLDWIATTELPRLQEVAIDINFEGCAMMAKSRMKAAERMLPLLRKAGKKAIEQAADVLTKEWEASLKSKLPSLNSIIERELSPEKTPASSSTPSASPTSGPPSATPPSGTPPEATS